MATIPEIKVHFSIQHTDIPSYLAKAFSIIVKRSRPPHEAKFGYNSDLRSRTYRFVNARNGESGPSDSKGLAGARAEGGASRISADFYGKKGPFGLILAGFRPFMPLSCRYGVLTWRTTRNARYVFRLTAMFHAINRPFIPGSEWRAMRQPAVI
jgi:hypothetical protein